MDIRECNLKKFHKSYSTDSTKVFFEYTSDNERLIIYSDHGSLLINVNSNLKNCKFRYGQIWFKDLEKELYDIERIVEEKSINEIINRIGYQNICIKFDIYKSLNVISYNGFNVRGKVNV